MRKDRRAILNDLLELKGNIRVFCRIRPTTNADTILPGSIVPVTAQDSETLVLAADKVDLHTFDFDRVFDAQEVRLLTAVLLMSLSRPSGSNLYVPFPGELPLWNRVLGQDCMPVLMCGTCEVWPR